MDHAAATPVTDSVVAAMQPFWTEQFYNPSALYGPAREAKAALERARSSVAQTIGARPSEIVFTSGATESANLAVQGVMTGNVGGHMVYSAVEHDAVRMSAQRYDATVCPVDAQGVVDVAALDAAIRPETVLVSVIYGNNEVGTVQPLKSVVDVVAQHREARRQSGMDTPLYVHTDAAQAPLYLDCNVARLGVDLLTLNGGKIGGPKQSGILYMRAGTIVQPVIAGGGQEMGIRSGTENVAFAIGFAQALAAAQSTHAVTAKSVGTLSRWFARQLEDTYGATINGHRKKRLPNNIHATFPGCDNERVLFALDQMGIYAATGSACSASSDEPSHVLRAMGISDKHAQSSLRFTIASSTTKQQLDHVLTSLKPALEA